MRREGLWKQVAAIGLAGSMLLTSVSPGFAEEISAVPEELAGAGSYIDEDAEDYSVDIDAAEDDDASTRDEELSDSLIEDSDILLASDDSDQMILITFDAGEGSNFQAYDDESGEWLYNGGKKREVEAYPGEEVYTPDEYEIEAEGKRLIGWTDEEGNSYYCGESCTFTESTTLTAVWEEQIKITFDAGEGCIFAVYDDETGETSFTGGEKREVEAYPGDEVYTPDEYEIEVEGKRLIGWTDEEGNSYYCGESCTFTESTTLTAVWEDQLLITFNAGDGSNFQVYDQESGEWSYTGGPKRVVEAYPDEEVSIPSEYDIQIEGKRLIGWTDEEGNSYDCGTSSTFSESTTLTAVWEEPIKITFDGGEGSNYRVEDEESGKWTYTGGSEYLVTVYSDEDQYVWTPYPEFFQAQDKVLTGWIDEDGNSYRPGERIEVTGNMTLTAQWDEAVTFTLYPNGGDWDGEYEDGEPAIVKFSANEKEYVYMDDFPRPERDGWICIGWADEDHNPVLFDDEDEDSDYGRIKVEQDMKLSALWAEAVTITYDPGEGYWDKDDEDGTIDNSERTRQFVQGREIGIYNSPRPEHDSKAFLGWKNENGELVLPVNGTDGKTIPAEEPMTLYAAWGDAYKLTLKVNNGYWYKSDDYVENEDRVLNVAQGSAIDYDDIEDDPGHDTKFFAGWATDAAGKNIVLSRNIWEYTPTDNVTLYAAWTDPVTVTFNGNGGKSSWEKDSAGRPVEKYTTKYAKGDDVELYREMFMREGYIITGWNINGTKYNSPYVQFTVNTNTTVTAQWAVKVTVTLDPNGGVFEDNEDSEDDRAYEEYAQGDRLTPSWPVKENYAFMGWSLEKGSDEIYIDFHNNKNVKAEKNITLYAVWAEAYAVTFNTNYGLNDLYDYSETMMIPKGKSLDEYDYPYFHYPNNNGNDTKAFSHWALDQNDEKPVSFSDPVTEDMVVYAIWEPGVKITFDLNGGTNYGSTSFWTVVRKGISIGDHFYYGSDITPPTGKTFGGWSLKRNDKSTKISMYQLTQNVTLYALWNAPVVKPVVKKPADKITISKAPSGVKAKAAKKGKATLTWKKFKQTKKTKAIWKKIKNVEVQYSTDKNFRTGVISKKLGKKKTKLTVKKLKAKTTYYFRVRYVEGPYKVSKWSAVKKVKAKK